MSSNLRDVAKSAGVSPATASMALNDRPGVNSDTRARVIRAAEELNYSPNANARSLIMRRSGAVGLVVTDITNPFFGMLTNEINTYASRAGYNLTIGVSNDDIRLEAASVRRMMEERAEGVIVVPCAAARYDLTHLFNLKKAGIPLVFATTRYEGISADCVMCDLAKGSYMLIKHLIESGRRRIMLLCGQREVLFSSLRIAGYRRAFEECGVKMSEDWIIPSEPNFPGGSIAAEKALAHHPDAITAINDVMAMGALARLKENGLRVPEDIAIAGYDDLIYSSLLETPLTTVRQPIADIASSAMELLMRRIEGENGVTELLIEPMLKLRKTTE